MEIISQFVDHFQQTPAFGLEVEKDLVETCKNMLKGSSVKWFWKSRIKDAESARAKLEAKARERKSNGTLPFTDSASIFADIKDLVAGRIIYLRSNDFQEIEGLIRKTFPNVVSKKPKTEIPLIQEQEGNTQRFRGYAGRHFVKWPHPPTFKDEKPELRVEIQVMSVFMWAYAELKHDITYKEPHGPPTLSQRRALETLRGVINLGEVAEQNLADTLAAPINRNDFQGSNACNNLTSVLHNLRPGASSVHQNDIDVDSIVNAAQTIISNKCLRDLRITDPRDDKERIEQDKGGLLRDSYCWILDNDDFQRWRNNPDSQLLWVKGDPGKGKTMLLCGIINELSKPNANLPAFFFCQATDSRINSATAVLRGLIYLLVSQQSSLVTHVQKKYDHAGKDLSWDVNAWVALSGVFKDILQDPGSKSTCLIVDALDECETDRDKLLSLVVESTSTFPHVKWIVSSRNKSDIEAGLKFGNVRMSLSLELNAEHVSRAIEIYIDFKVSQLTSVVHDSTLQETLRNQMYVKANGTFLWAALVLKELEYVENWDVLDVLQEMPPGLEPLYDRIIRQVQQLQRKNPEFCCLVLSTMTLAYRPLHLLEVGALSSLPGKISTTLDNIIKVVNNCGSFLTVREGIVSFVHQSAKDYLLKNKSNEMFLFGKEEAYYIMFSRSLQVMSKILKRDIYNLRAPGISID